MLKASCILTCMHYIALILYDISTTHLLQGNSFLVTLYVIAIFRTIYEIMTKEHLNKVKSYRDLNFVTNITIMSLLIFYWESIHISITSAIFLLPSIIKSKK